MSARRRLRRPATLLIAVACTACAAGAVNAATDGATPAVDRVPAVSPAQARALEALARDQRAGDAIESAAAGPFAANPALARRVDTPAGPAWVIPADGHVCLRATDATGAVWACVGDGDAAAGRLVLTLRAGDDTLQAIYGVLPAGASDARLEGSQGTDSIDATEGVFASRAPGAEALAFTNAQGDPRRAALP